MPPSDRSSPTRRARSGVSASYASAWAPPWPVLRSIFRQLGPEDTRSRVKIITPRNRELRRVEGPDSTRLMPACEQPPRVFHSPGRQLLSVNAKQLERPGFQPGPSRCESDHGCHFGPRSSVRSERRRAKPEVTGAIPVVDTISQPLCLSSYRAGFVNPYSSVRVRPGAPFHQGRDVTVASPPVTRTVRVRIPSP